VGSTRGARPLLAISEGVNMSLASFLLGSGLRRVIFRRVPPAIRKQKPRIEQLESRELLSGFHLDFGTATSPVAAGYTRMALAAYNPTTGYGWGSPPGLSAYNKTTSNALTRDGHTGTNSTFKVDVANGIYQVTATLGHPTALRDKVDVLAEGILEAAGVTTAAGQFRQVTFQVGVNDGQLSLQFIDRGGKEPKFLAPARA